MRPNLLSFPCLLPLILILTFTTGCQKESIRHTNIPHIIIQNQSPQEEQNLSKFFEPKVIVVNKENAGIIPGKVRNFEYINNTLYLIRRVPTGTITAIQENGKVQWQLLANSDPLTAFTSLGEVSFDLDSGIIRVLDDQEHKFYIYDFNGDFLRQEDAPKVYINDLYVSNDGNRLFSVTAYKNEFEFQEENQTKAALVSFHQKNNGSNPNNILLNNYSYNQKAVPYKDYKDFFSNNDGKLFYHQDFKDTIFHVQNSVPIPSHTFSFAQNDKRKEIKKDPKSNPLILQQLLDDNIPRSYFAVPDGNYFLVSYAYNRKEIFSMIDMTSGKTLFNTQNYTCDGKSFSGRLDYSNGILLNQMYAGNYQQLNGEEEESVDTKYLDNSFVYTILLPKW